MIWAKERTRRKHTQQNGSQWKRPNQTKWRTEYYVYIEPDLHNNMCYTLQSRVTLFFSLSFLFFGLYMWNWKHRFSCCFLFITNSEFHSVLRFRRFIFGALFDFTLIVFVVVGVVVVFFICRFFSLCLFRISYSHFVLCSVFPPFFCYYCCCMSHCNFCRVRELWWHSCIVCNIVRCVQVRRLNMPVLDVNEITTQNADDNNK